MKTLKTLGAAFALALPLTACSGLLGGGGSADIYHFGALPAGDAPETPTGPAGGPEAAAPATLLYAGATFGSAIDSDRILTVNGLQANYIADARWVAPASELFDAATVRAIERRTPSARVVRIRGAPLPQYALGVDVRRFEADYVAGPQAPPEVVIEARVRLMRWSDRTLLDEWQLSAHEPLTENRMAVIVAAFDRGTASITRQIADRTQQTLAATAALETGAPRARP